jgi:hypothetical protein
LYDPDGQSNELYYGIEQIGWDGKPRPKELRQPIRLDDWPDSLDHDANAYLGETFSGPWG